MLVVLFVLCSQSHVEKEGLRRVLADICLLCFHLVISGVTHRGVDLGLAESILNWNIERFPNGE